MRISEFFTVPKGEKITEKMMARVLISSICGILLCMVCLAGTTWAWFTVSIENKGNVIQIAQNAEAVVYVNDVVEPFYPGTQLPDDTQKIKIVHNSNPDVFNQKATLYVTIMLDQVPVGYVVLDSTNGYAVELQYADSPKALSWIASWLKPDVNPLQGYTLNAAAADEKGSPSTEETTAPPETTGFTTPPTDGATEPTDAVTPSTEPSSEVTTAPTTEGEPEEPTTTKFGN